MSNTPDPGIVVANAASAAVSHARQKFAVTLDYSEASIEEVEKILETVHAQRPKGFFAKLLRRGPTASEMERIAMAYGCYIGEVMRRSFGGHWVLESALAPGSRVLTLLLSDKCEVWPHFKVGKRLSNGSEDNVWHYYQVARRKFQNK